jgi:ketosteroid isomerase-like protein
MSNLDTVQAIYAAFGRGDVEAILDQLADDVAWDHDAPSYGVPLFEPGTGKEHARRFFEATAALEFHRFEPTNFLVGGNQVAVPIDVKAEVKSSGRVAEVLEIHLWTFGDDGKVSRFFHSIDRQAFVQAYGLAESAAATAT